MANTNFARGTEVNAVCYNMVVNGLIDYVDDVCVVVSTDADISFPIEECSEVQVVTGIERVERGYLFTPRAQLTNDRILRRAM